MGDRGYGGRSAGAGWCELQRRAAVAVAVAVLQFGGVEFRRGGWIVCGMARLPDGGFGLAAGDSGGVDFPGMRDAYGEFRRRALLADSVLAVRRASAGWTPVR